MGRVNLDLLELLKDQESSCEEEDEGDVMGMVGDENVARMEDEEEEEEEEVEEEEQEEEQEVMASIQEERAMDDEEMEGIKEEEEEREEDVKDDAAEGRHPVPGRTIPTMLVYSIAVRHLELTALGQLRFPEALASPVGHSGASGTERRLPCEFCGRCFTNSLEWERHVLRHGM